MSEPSLASILLKGHRSYPAPTKMYLFFFFFNLWVSEMALCVRAHAAKAGSSQDLRV